MLAGAERGHVHRRVQIARNRDDDGIDVLAGHQLLVVFFARVLLRRLAELGLHLGDAPAAMPVVRIGDCLDADIGLRQRSIQQSTPAAADADEADPDHLVGFHRLGGRTDGNCRWRSPDVRTGSNRDESRRGRYLRRLGQQIATRCFNIMHHRCSPNSRSYGPASVYGATPAVLKTPSINSSTRHASSTVASGTVLPARACSISSYSRTK